MRTSAAAKLLGVRVTLLWSLLTRDLIEAPRKDKHTGYYVWTPEDVDKVRKFMTRRARLRQDLLQTV